MSGAGGYPPLKDLLGPEALGVIADAGAAASASFDRPAFVAAVSAGLEALSVMERVRRIADALHAALPVDYPAALTVVRRMAPQVTHSFQVIGVTEFVARYGLDDFDRSMAALAELTRYGTAEFAVRPFLVRDHARAMETMLRWCTDENEHVRRLASEGSRPRLPWATRIPTLAADPTRGAPILEALRADPSPYVRKSVANHLNDIAKDRADWLVARIAAWPVGDRGTAWIVRHGLRTLIKNGDPRALALVGAEAGAAVEVRRFSVEPAVVRLGDTISIAVELRSSSTADQRLVVDYRIHYARARGGTAAKVFKLQMLDLAAGETATFGRRQAVRDFSTRRHYPGRHAVELLVNGRTLAEAAFDLVVPESAIGSEA